MLVVQRLLIDDLSHQQTGLSVEMSTYQLYSRFATSNMYKTAIPTMPVTVFPTWNIASFRAFKTYVRGQYATPLLSSPCLFFCAIAFSTQSHFHCDDACQGLDVSPRKKTAILNVCACTRNFRATTFSFLFLNTSTNSPPHDALHSFQTSTW